MPQTTHLIGAYGLRWDRREVIWQPGPGPRFELLGRRHTNRPNLRLCDFRNAAGVYVLERSGRPIYAGLARSGQGLGSRLLTHTKDGTKNWTRFSWFSFDSVRLEEPFKTKDPFPQGWALVHPRDVLGTTRMQDVVGELEALLVNLLFDGRGMVNIQRPRFPNAKPWHQVTRSNFRSPGICHRVDAGWFGDPSRLT